MKKAELRVKGQNLRGKRQILGVWGECFGGLEEIMRENMQVLR